MCLFLFSFSLHCWLYIVDFLPALHTFMIYWTSWWRKHRGSEKVMFPWCPLFPLLGRQDVVHSPQCSQALGWPGAHLHFVKVGLHLDVASDFLVRAGHISMSIALKDRGRSSFALYRFPDLVLQPPPSSASKFGKCLEQQNSRGFGAGPLPLAGIFFSNHHNTGGVFTLCSRSYWPRSINSCKALKLSKYLIEKNSCMFEASQIFRIVLCIHRAAKSPIVSSFPIEPFSWAYFV